MKKARPYKSYTLHGVRRVKGPAVDVNVAHLNNAFLVAAILNTAYHAGKIAARRLSGGKK
jgi:hypothetical protein